MAPFPPMADWLTPLDKALLNEAIRKTNAQLVEHISPDTCQKCGGLGCNDCRDCPCPRNSCKRKRSGR